MKTYIYIYIYIYSTYIQILFYLFSELDLSNNNLKYLPKDLLPEFKLNISNISMELKVTGNQWVCNCHNLWLIEVLKNLNDNEKVDADCNSPPDFKGTALTDLEQNALPCEYEDQFNPNLIDFGLPSAKSKR